MVIPVAMGLLNEDGSEAVPTQLLILTEESQSYSFDGLQGRPIPSLLRGFSAPVILQRSTTKAERLILLAFDTDMFNRYEASRELGRAVLIDMLCNTAAPDQAIVKPCCKCWPMRPLILPSAPSVAPYRAKMRLLKP